MGASRALATAAVAAAVVVPLAAGVGLSVWALAVSPMQSAAEVEPSIAQVQSAGRTDQSAVTLTLVPGEAVTVTTQSTGIVTELSISEGEALDSGDSAMRVNDAEVTVYVAASPLYRDLSQGLSGDDVATAQALLIELDYLDGKADGKFGPVTAQAVEDFNEARGYGKDNAVLSLGSLLWIPPGAGAPGEVTVRVGADLLPGTELFSTTEGQDVITVSVEAVDVDRIVDVGGTVAELAAGVTMLSEASVVEELSRVFFEGDTAQGSIELAVPREVGTVAAAALVTDASGTVCFFSDTTGPATVVEAAEGSFGVVDVDAGLVGTDVLLNPRDTREDLTCG